MPSSGWNGIPSLRTTITPSGAPRGPGDFEGHWDATSRQANNHDTLTAQMP